MSSPTTHLDPTTRTAQLAADAREGLTAARKTLPPKYFYDATGSELFDRITRLPEYYPTRAERAILTERATEIAAVTRAEALDELGSGTSEKTRILLDALTATGTLRHVVAFDVDPTVLAEAGAALAAEYPSLDVVTVVGDFEQHLDLLPAHPRRLIAFLGSTIGNFEPPARAGFLRAVRATMRPGDAFLLGTDLVKDVDRLVRAYDDAEGVTAAFDKNVLAVLNRELGADFDLAAFEHVAVWDPVAEVIEMRLRSVRRQTVHLATLGLDVPFEQGETLRTEISAKFRREGVETELAAAGLRLAHWWTDPAGDFALSLSVPA